MKSRFLTATYSAALLTLIVVGHTSAQGVRAAVQNSEALLSRAELGADCFYDAFCASEHCSSRLLSFWSKGLCVECNTDGDCPGKGESMPGEHPVAFCYKANNGSTLPRCSEWKRGDPIDERGYPIWYHGASEAQWIPRTILDEGPVMDQVWHWDLNNQPAGTRFEVTETHVSIPVNAHTIAAYSRTYHNYQEHESGIVTTTFLKNAMSVLTPNAVAGMAEKYHTLKYNGTISTLKADRVRREVAARDDATQRWVERGRTWRGFQMGAALTASGAVIAQQLEAAQDQYHLDQIRDYVQKLLQDGSSLENLASAGWNDHSEEAKQALVDAETLPSMKSENHCKHFETGAGIQVTDTHIVIPLNSAFMANSGEMQFSPGYYFGLNSGVTIAKHDAKTNTLEFYYKASQMFRSYSDPKIAPEEWPFPSGLWVAPVHPSVPVISTDGRTDQYYHQTDADIGMPLKFLISRYLSKPVDYSIYDGGIEKTCPDDLRNSLKSVWVKAKLEEESETGNLMAKLSSMSNVLLAAVVGAPCGSTFMRSDYGHGTVGLELNEYSSWAHVILEVDPDHTESVVTSQFWDDWDLFFKHSD